MLKSAQKATRDEGGFTLIELLVVMIIIAILMAVAVPTFLKQKQNAVRTQATSNIKQVVNTIESCATDNIDGTINSPAAGGSQCANWATLIALEPTLGNIAPVPVVTALGTTGYTVRIDTATGGSFTESHSATGIITKDCTAGSEGAGKACKTTAPAGKMW